MSVEASPTAPAAGAGLDVLPLDDAAVERWNAEPVELNLTDLDGIMDLARNDSEKLRLINVWATWCISCRVEHPYLTRLAAEGVPIYGINYKDDPQEAVNWLVQLGDPYRLSVVDAEGSLGLDLGVYGAPETYVVDRNGVVRYRHVGVVDERVWTEILGPIVDELQREPG